MVQLAGMVTVWLVMSTVSLIAIVRLVSSMSPPPEVTVTVPSHTVAPALSTILQTAAVPAAGAAASPVIEAAVAVPELELPKAFGVV
jgi:hypothetical protein